MLPRAVRETEQIWQNTEIPDHPAAAEAMMIPAPLFAIAEQAAIPDASSEKEIIPAFTVGSALARKGESPPVSALKKATKAQTFMTAPEADATDSVNTENIG